MVWAVETYKWPPSVVRQQSERDLLILHDAQQSMTT